ncbi:MAG: prolyl-tRNA synthetase associated domain-containing protein, partial [Desulfobacterales bacterium]|nr:prolyl-tRNA synthetase associated domain-containing protein [Desulfobacterales bacterium]
MIPGAVTPFAAVNIPKDREVRIILDEEMMKNDLLNFHPLVNTATTTIKAGDLVKFLEHVGQAPEIIQL